MITLRPLKRKERKATKKKNPEAPVKTPKALELEAFEEPGQPEPPAHADLLVCVATGILFGLLLSYGTSNGYIADTRYLTYRVPPTVGEN